MEIEQLCEAYFDPRDRLKPYRDDEEYLTDMFRFLDVLFTIACGLKGLNGGSFPPSDTVGKARGLSVSSEDLFSILKPEADAALTKAGRRQLEDAFFHFECRTRRSIRTGFIPRFEKVCQKLRLSGIERFAAMLALSVVYDRKYEGVYTYLHNNTSDFLPSYWLIERLYAILSDRSGVTERLTDGDLPFTRFIAETDVEPRKRGVSASRAVMRGCVASYILGGDSREPRLNGYIVSLGVTLGKDYIEIRAETLKYVRTYFTSHAFRDNGCAVLNLYGPDGIGRRYTAGLAAGKDGFPLLVVNIRRITLLNAEQMLKVLDMVYVECVLKSAIPCFIYDKEDSSGQEGKKTNEAPAALETAAEYITRLFRFVFWITAEKETVFLRTAAEFSALELPMLTGAERKRFWDAYADAKDYDAGIDLNIVSGQYILTPRDIKRVCTAARERSRADGTKITKDILRKSIRQYSINQLGHYAVSINAVFTWDDLVVDDDRKREMKMICDQVRYRSAVNEEWGFAKKTPYGRGLCALFYGSPGTGKTMAVQVMANELGLDLYRIDLSQMTSKYIGETQKNISELFDRAKNINAMLFFDEADSMFAKRSEVKDSNDRYANADTAFLLQKLEDYEGITILATNYVNNIDDAFKRRIKFMVNFAFPEPSVRLTLWNKILPSAAKLDEKLDFEFFAEKFELSGSSIKEILTNAAFMAAAEGSGLRNSHIVEAIKLNFSKFGKILTDEDFGYLGHLS